MGMATPPRKDEQAAIYSYYDALWLNRIHLTICALQSATHTHFSGIAIVADTFQYVHGGFVLDHAVFALLLQWGASLLSISFVVVVPPPSPVLIEDSAPHLTKPQQGSPAIWTHLHIESLAANETLWRNPLLMFPSPVAPP